MQKIFFSVSSGPLLPALRASVDAHGSCMLVPASSTKLLLQEASDFRFLLWRWGDVQWFDVGSVGFDKINSINVNASALTLLHQLLLVYRHPQL